MNEQPPIFSTKADAFVWGLLSGACLLGFAAIVGRIAWQVFS